MVNASSLHKFRTFPLSSDMLVFDSGAHQFIKFTLSSKLEEPVENLFSVRVCLRRKSVCSRLVKHKPIAYLKNKHPKHVHSD